MTTTTIGLLYGGATLSVMFAGMPIAFALGAVVTVFMIALHAGRFRRYHHAERL